MNKSAILLFYFSLIALCMNGQSVMRVSEGGNVVYQEKIENIDSIYFSDSFDGSNISCSNRAASDSLYKKHIIGYFDKRITYQTSVGYISETSVVIQINYCYSTPIHLLANQTIMFSGMVETAVNAISLTNSEGSSFSSLIKGHGPIIDQYKYTAEESCYVSICYCTDKPIELISFISNPSGEVNERISNLEKNMVKYDNAEPDISENPLRTLNYHPGFSSIFKSWGFIGDSMTEGVIQYKDTNGNMHYDVDTYYSWGQRLCSSTGANGVNFATGGTTAREWIKDESIKGWGGAKSNLKQAYIIALGYNDRWIYECGAIETDVDVSNYENNKETFAGSYAGIIQRIKSVS